jgi:NCAIR mutase (PurE)-related protein
MNRRTIVQLADRLLRRELTLDEFIAQLEASAPTIAELSSATLDLDRRRRCGYPEVVFGEGKSADSLVEIIRALVERGENVLATRIDADKGRQLRELFSTGRYNHVAKTFRIDSLGRRKDVKSGRVSVITAGTSDLPVAEEARETLDWMGVDATMIHDVGVAGPHRLPAKLPSFEDSDAIVVVAGMEGALPSVVGGYVACPVIAVPTSVGYGASLGGIAALLSMLNSCASNVAVVNIDAGFKGGYLAGLIAIRRHGSASDHARQSFPPDKV